MPKYDSLGYYAILEVHPEADISEIKRQYYQKAKYWHPDHNTRPEAQDMFQTTSIAYGVMQNPRTRLIYDLLSCVYDSRDFPPMGSLKIYKNQSNKDDKALRVLKQRLCTNKGVRESKDVCNIREAGNMVLSTAISNWLKGWWQKDGFNRTLSAIRFNMQNIYADDADNLKLLIHNAVAYEQENNKEMAWIYAKQAELMQTADEHTAKYLKRFIEMLDFHPEKKVILPYWNAAELKRKQQLFPLTALLIAVLIGVAVLARNGVFSGGSAQDNSYYEVRKIGDNLVPSDMIEARIMKNDSTPQDKDAIAHLAADSVIYYGPDTRYSPLRKGVKGQTVRITGYTVDKKWYQIILDDGIIGYIRNKDLREGFGNPVPEGSSVYKG